MHTTKQIISNQQQYKEEIIAYLLKENQEAAMEVIEIQTTDPLIMQEKEKFLKRLRKANVAQLINKFFFGKNKRNDMYYAWWDVVAQEARILKYAKK